MVISFIVMQRLISLSCVRTEQIDCKYYFVMVIFHEQWSPQKKTLAFWARLCTNCTICSNFSPTLTFTFLSSFYLFSISYFYSIFLISFFNILVIISFFLFFISLSPFLSFLYHFFIISLSFFFIFSLSSLTSFVAFVSLVLFVVCFRFLVTLCVHIYLIVTISIYFSYMYCICIFDICGEDSRYAYCI